MKEFIKLVIKFVLILFVFVGIIFGSVILYSKISGKELGDLTHNDVQQDEKASKTVLIAGLHPDGPLTDFIMIAKYNPKTGRVNAMSIPRDTKVVGTIDGKINSAYATKKRDIKFLAEKVKDLTGISVDNYVLLDTGAVRKMVDAIGGIPMNVPFDMDYDDNEQNLHIKLKKGQEERDSTTHALVPTVGSTLEIDYFQKKYGGLPLKVETFDNCDNMPPTKTCEVFDSTTKLFIGSDCTNDANGDPDTEKNTETGEEYENKYENNYGPFEGNMPAPGFGEGGELCSDILNGNLSKLVKLCITILRIAGAVIAVVNGMIALIPAVVSKNPDALKKAGHKCMLMGVILLAIGVFPTLLRVIAKIFGYDVSCIF